MPQHPEQTVCLGLARIRPPLNHIALTGTHHVPSMLHRLGLDAFDLYVFSTYAHDQLTSLVDAGLEFGVGVELG